MGALGGSAGYLTVNPTENYVGQAIQNAGDSFARVRAEKYQKEKDKMAAEQNLREQRRQDFKDSEEFSAKYPYAYLGDNDKQFVMNLKKTYTEARRDVVNTGSEKSQALADKALSNLTRLNESKKAMSIKADEMLANEKNYNPTSFNKVKGLVGRLNKDLVADIDENGNFVHNLVKRDPSNGTIIGIEKKNISDGELKQMFEIEPNFDVTGEKGMNAQFIKSLKTPTPNSKMEGNNKVTTTSYPEAPALAETFATEATQNHSGVYYALEKIKQDANGQPISLDPEDKANYSNPEVLKLVHDYYKNNLLELAPSGRDVDPNFEAANHALSLRKEANDEKQRKADNAFKQQEFSQKELEKGFVTVGQTKVIFTAQGKAAQKKFYGDPKNKGVVMTSADYPPGENYYVERTSKKVNPKANAQKGNAKPAPKKEDLRSKYKY